MTAEGQAGRARQPWRSLRVRITLAATAVFVIVFALASFGLIARVNSSLEDDLRDAGMKAIRCVSGQLASGADPQAAVQQSCTVGVPLEVRTVDGHLIAGAPPDGASGNPGGQVTSTFDVAGRASGAGTAEADELLVQGEAQSPKGDLAIVARQPLDSVRRTTDTLRRLLLVLVPLLALGVAAIVWVVVDRALRPVDRMRAEVDQISHSTMSRRLPEPGSASEIDKLAHTMNEMLDRLETSSTQQRQFVSDAGHELKTPLATLRTSVEVALRQPDPDWPSVAERVLTSERRLEALVDDLLTLARFDEDAPSVPTAPQMIDLEELVVAWLAATTVDERISVDLGGVDACRIPGDERELRRLVGNLLDNAVRHARSRVTVTLGTRSDLVELVVDDDGPGVPVAQREALFDRIVRLDPARARSDADATADAGTGLGLAIAMACAIRHGGSITVDDSPLGGARFTTTLRR